MIAAVSERVLTLLEESGALMTGHFELASGLHSDRYCQCARLLEDPGRAEEVGRALAERFRSDAIDVVVSPALGGIIIGHEVARALGVRSIFAERREGRMILRRGFGVIPGENALVVEDVVTTGSSVGEVADLVRGSGATVAGFGFIVDRSAGDLDMGAAARSLTRLDIETYARDTCPLCLRGVPIDKPGSGRARTRDTG